MSCDPSVTFHRTVENHSDYTLQLVVKKAYSNTDTIDLGVNQEIEYLHDSHRGRRKEYEDCENRYYGVDTIFFIVKNDSSRQVNVDPIGTQDWVFTTTNKTMNGGGNCNCKLIITNSMIE